MDIEGLKCMSLGFFGDVAASPLILSRMLTHTKWDNLDYLVIDASEKDLQSIALTELKINGGLVVK
jgi:Mrp family chromosome partitioning ATPase